MKEIIFLSMYSVVVSTNLLAQHELPKLHYSYQSMAPYIDSTTMNIHYNKHHSGYVNNLNKSIKGTNAEHLSIDSLMQEISKYESSVRNNGGGHYNHSLFWKIITPNGNGKISDRLLENIVKTFGSMEEFKSKFEYAASSRFGSGWAWLSVDKDKKLFISSTANQDNPLMDVINERGTPILGVDVWEHAYYLNYQNRRADYLKNIWQIINWEEVSNRYDQLAPKGKFDDWPEIKTFHKVMSHIYHASEDGNLEPIKTRSNELYQSAIILSQSKIPAGFQNNLLSNHIKDLVKNTKDLDRLVKRKSKDKSIIAALSKTHDVFHQIVGLCSDESDH